MDPAGAGGRDPHPGPVVLHPDGCAPRLATTHPHGIGWLCAAIICAEINDARRFTSSDQLVRFAGMDITVYYSDAERSPGHLSRQGSPELRWTVFEAAKCAARPGSPDYVSYHHLAVERKLLRRCYHTLR